jgi:hypothetical protein
MRARLKKHKAPEYPGPFNQGSGWLAIALSVACCVLRHSLTSPRRGTMKLSPIFAKESSRSKAKTRQNGGPNSRKVLLTYDMRNIYAFSGSPIFSVAYPIQTPKRHRGYHIALCPAPFWAERTWQRDTLQFMVPLFNRAWLHGRNWHNRYQLAATLGYDHHGPFLHHFRRSKAGIEITDKDLAGLGVKIDWHNGANIPGGGWSDKETAAAVEIGIEPED